MRKLKYEDFDFIDYYENVLTTSQEKTYFRELIKKKLGHSDHKTVHNWIYHKKAPSMAELHIVDIINNPDFKLPRG